jgi:hypothetical protein
LSTLLGLPLPGPLLPCTTLPSLQQQLSQQQLRVACLRLQSAARCVIARQVRAQFAVQRASEDMDAFLMDAAARVQLDSSQTSSPLSASPPRLALQSALPSPLSPPVSMWSDEQCDLVLDALDALANGLTPVAKGPPRDVAFELFGSEVLVLPSAGSACPCLALDALQAAQLHTMLDQLAYDAWPYSSGLECSISTPKPVGEVWETTAKPIGVLIMAVPEPVGATHTAAKPLGALTAATAKPVGSPLAVTAKPVGALVTAVPKPVGVVTAFPPQHQVQVQHDAQAHVYAHVYISSIVTDMSVPQLDPANAPVSLPHQHGETSNISRLSSSPPDFYQHQQLEHDAVIECFLSRLSSEQHFGSDQRVPHQPVKSVLSSVTAASMQLSSSQCECTWLGLEQQLLTCGASPALPRLSYALLLASLAPSQTPQPACYMSPAYTYMYTYTCIAPVGHDTKRDTCVSKQRRQCK